LGDDKEASITEWSRASMALMEEIRPFLVGKGPEVQSAALADMTAMWLAGMFLTDSQTGQIARRETDKLREVSLKMFIKVVRELVSVNEELITKPLFDKQKGTIQ
jgi:hypothetical protein